MKATSDPSGETAACAYAVELPEIVDGHRGERHRETGGGQDHLPFVSRMPLRSMIVFWSETMTLILSGQLVDVQVPDVVRVLAERLVDRLDRLGAPLGLDHLALGFALLPSRARTSSARPIASAICLASIAFPN